MPWYRVWHGGQKVSELVGDGAAGLGVDHPRVLKSGRQIGAGGGRNGLVMTFPINRNLAEPTLWFSEPVWSCLGRWV